MFYYVHVRRSQLFIIPERLLQRTLRNKSIQNPYIIRTLLLSLIIKMSRSLDTRIEETKTVHMWSFTTVRGMYRARVGRMIFNKDSRM